LNIEEYREFCISKPGVTEGMPFGPDVLVFKVMGKMFALCGLEPFVSFNAKCDPERAAELREQYDGIIPGYHMSKVHWNTISTDGSISDKLMYELIDHSYELITAGLSKKLREELKNIN